MHSILYFTTAVAYGHYIGRSFSELPFNTICFLFHSFDFTVVIGIANVDREDYIKCLYGGKGTDHGGTGEMMIDYPLKRAC